MNLLMSLFSYSSFSLLLNAWFTFWYDPSLSKHLLSRGYNTSQQHTSKKSKDLCMNYISLPVFEMAKGML